MRERSDRKRQRNTQFLDLLFLLSLLCTINKGVYAKFTPVILYGGTRFVRSWVYMMGKTADFYFLSCFSFPPPPAGGWVEGGGGLLSLRFRFLCFCGASVASGTMAKDAEACFIRKAFFAVRQKMPFLSCPAGSSFGSRCPLHCGLQPNEERLQPAIVKGRGFPASLCSAGSSTGSKGQREN